MGTLTAPIVSLYTAGPGPVEVRQNAAGIQCFGDFGLGPSIFYEGVEYLLDDGDLSGWPWDQGDAIRLDALVLTALQNAFRDPMLVDQHAPQAETGRTALTITEFDQSALTCEDLLRQLAAVFSGHGALDTFDDR